MGDLDDAAYAAFAWRRFRRILTWMAALSVAAALGALGVLWWWVGIVSPHMAIATVIGIGLTVFLGATLMTLVFLSNGSGHDARVDELNAGRDPGRDRNHP